MLKKLASVADSLDKKGFEHLADKVDLVFTRLAQPITVQNIKDDLSQIFRQNLVIGMENRNTLDGLVPVFSIKVPDNGLSFEAALEPRTQQLSWIMRIDKEKSPTMEIINKAAEILRNYNIDYDIRYKEPGPESEYSGASN